MAHNKRIGRQSTHVLRQMAEQSFSRVAGAPLVTGNRIELLKDASDNYPAWLEAIEAARRTIYMEMYLVHNDNIGRRFAGLLEAKAKEGVKVRVLYDWLGRVGYYVPQHLWSPLRKAGGEVRSCNPPRFDNFLGWTSRDHRKVLCVDGKVAFVSGLCIGQDWIGHPERGIPGWRDTGVRIKGPAVADIEESFAASWQLWGEAIPVFEFSSREEIVPAGDQALRVIATTPETSKLFQLDLLMTAIARDTLWLTDAYFMGTKPYLQALSAAARDGVDVRLLVPGGSNVPVINIFSKTLYRPLLKSGVRIFEWNGPMMHAKSAVVDRRWARVGSSNINIMSFFGNWELDIAADDEKFAGEMEDMYLQDLENSTELFLAGQKMFFSPRELSRQGKLAHSLRQNIRTGTLIVRNAMRSGASHSRPVEPEAAGALVTIAVTLLALTVLIYFFPAVLIFPLLFITTWIAAIFFTRAVRLRLKAKRHMKKEK
ncbi:cardiolipin synthase B [candidate division KSB1 bacterium]|nr:cardiolipin synthase B [candidate division KSB1 bacterium]